MCNSNFEGLNMKTELLILFALLSFSVFAIAPIQAFTITTDEITQTSIVWNLSQKPEGVTISEIVLDGIIVSEFSINATKIVQSNLDAGETHIITVIDSRPEVSELEAKTLPITKTESETFFTSINLYILILLSLIFVIVAVYTRINFISFIGSVIAFIGLIGSVGNNFLTGVIFALMFIVTLFVGFTD